MVSGFLRGWIGGGSRQPPDSRAARILSVRPMPAAVYAVGDVHGCVALYRALEDRIVADARTRDASEPCLIVLLGDVVDRGPDSAGMIRHLLSPAPDGVERVTLRGNHEEMMAQFLQDPGASRSWLDNGGEETLMSYGLYPDPEHGFADLSGRFRAQLDAAIPDAHRGFLERTPYALEVGNTVFCHAGIDPARALSAQHPADLIWGDPARIDTAAPGDHPRIVHGHVITEDVLITPKRINVDTGAYRSGVLSAVRLTADGEPLALCVGQQPLQTRHSAP